MSGIESIIAWVIQVILDLIGAVGLVGVFGLMTLESICLPIPSEVVLPFAGALVYQGRIGFSSDPVVGIVAVAVAGTLGCTVGSLIAYFIGLKGGRPLILRYGRYVRLSSQHLDTAERWFHRYGNWAVFGARLLPVVRTFISIPAGMARMNMYHFIILTTIGSFPWCLALTVAGYILGQDWQAIAAFYRPFEYVVVIGVLVLLAYYLWRRRAVKKDRPSA